jgi:hypothetical protein
MSSLLLWCRMSVGVLVLRRSRVRLLYFSVSHEWTNGDRRYYYPHSLVARENVCNGPEEGRFCCFLEQNFFVGDSHNIYSYFLTVLFILASSYPPNSYFCISILKSLVHNRFPPDLCSFTSQYVAPFFLFAPCGAYPLFRVFPDPP